ncbi:hypothetical protein [Nocardia sp. NPDC006630]|uniref:hypothetical protein n=1 Tax=Nocardia sp. NPDC006630 TaxID=3157181 RepID=UPI0033B2B193
MRRGRPTKAQLEQSFDRALLRSIAEGGIASGTGLDDETQNTLLAVARAYPNATDELVEAARRAFAGQLDGSSTARWRAEKHHRLTGEQEQ